MPRLRAQAGSPSSDLSKREVAQLRRAADRSFFEFARQVLGYDRLDERVHGELCEFLVDEEHKRKLILMPRGTFKSTIISVAYPLWRLTRDSDDHIMLDSLGTKLSKRNLAIIKQHCSKNRRFCDVYGNWRPPKGGEQRWSVEQIDIAPRQDYGRGDPSAQAFGLDGSNVGFHFKRIICDDLHDEKNTQTDEQIEKVRAHLHLLLSVLDPDGELIVVGTRWVDNDVYGAILDATERGQEEWAILKRRAYNDDGSLLLPNVLSAEYLAQLQKQQSPAVFSAQYLNDPLAGGRQMFTAPYRFFEGHYDRQTARFEVQARYELRDGHDGLVEDYTLRPVSLRGANVYMAVDPAGSEEKKADETAIVVVAVTADNHMWVMDADGGRWSPSQTVRAIYRMAKKWRPITVAVEEQGMAVYLGKALRDAERDEAFILPLRAVKPKARAKDQRIKALEPRHRGGTLIFHRSLRTRPVCTQFNRFPVCRHEDYLDALAYLEDVVVPAAAFEEETEERPAVERYALGMQVACF